LKGRKPGLFTNLNQFPWSWIRIWIYDVQINADQCGSGPTTLPAAYHTMTQPWRWYKFNSEYLIMKILLYTLKLTISCHTPIHMRRI
jgi:hypothetical protein